MYFQIIDKDSDSFGDFYEQCTDWGYFNSDRLSYGIYHGMKRDSGFATRTFKKKQVRVINEPGIKYKKAS